MEREGGCARGDGKGRGVGNAGTMRRRETTAGAQDTMMNVIALSGWQTLGLLDFYQLLLLLLLLPLLLLLLLPLLLLSLLLIARRSCDRPGNFSRNFQP